MILRSARFREDPGRLFDDADSALTYEFLDPVDEEAVGCDHDIVGFEDGAELAGLFEVEQQLALARGVNEDRVELVEERDVRIMERDLDAQGFGELELDVFKGLDAGDGELGGGVFFAAQDALGRGRGRRS